MSEPSKTLGFGSTVVFRFATYAIIATYVDGKKEVHTVKINHNLRTGESPIGMGPPTDAKPRKFLNRLRAEQKKKP